MRTGKRVGDASGGAHLSRTRASAKYGMLSNCLFMVGEAFRESPVVLVITMLQALLAVACSVLERLQIQLLGLSGLLSCIPSRVTLPCWC